MLICQLSFFFNAPATTEIYTLSLHDALPIFCVALQQARNCPEPRVRGVGLGSRFSQRSEEHTSELQSLRHLVCRLLLEKKTETRDRAVASVACSRLASPSRLWWRTRLSV